MFIPTNLARRDPSPYPNNMDNRDNIDFGKMNIPRLFVKLFVPTLLGLVFNAMLTLADGIFVG